MIWRWLACGLLFAGGCAPRTGDRAIDLVASREGPFSVCVITPSKTKIFSPGGVDGPPAMLTFDSFRDPAAREAAKRIAERYSPSDMDESYKPRLYGASSDSDCTLRVDAPAISGDHAFIWFSDPGGEIGAYALRRDGSGWAVVEKAKLGYW